LVENIVLLRQKTLHSSFTELVPEGAVSLEPSVAGDDVLHLGQEPAVNLPNVSRFLQLDGIYQQKDVKYFLFIYLFIFFFFCIGRVPDPTSHFLPTSFCM
jgi:hypothetical protein